MSCIDDGMIRVHICMVLEINNIYIYIYIYTAAHIYIYIVYIYMPCVAGSQGMRILNSDGLSC